MESLWKKQPLKKVFVSLQPRQTSYKPHNEKRAAASWNLGWEGACFMFFGKINVERYWFDIDLFDFFTWFFYLNIEFWYWFWPLKLCKFWLIWILIISIMVIDFNWKSIFENQDWSSSISDAQGLSLVGGATGNWSLEGSDSGRPLEAQTRGCPCSLRERQTIFATAKMNQQSSQDQKVNPPWHAPWSSHRRTGLSF